MGGEKSLGEKSLEDYKLLSDPQLGGDATFSSAAPRPSFLTFVWNEAASPQILPARCLMTVKDGCFVEAPVRLF